MASKCFFALPPLLRVTALRSARAFSVLNRPPPKYEANVPLNLCERSTLAAGSAVMSLLNPRRGGMSDGSLVELLLILLTDLIAALGETTATPYFIYRLRDAMLSSPTGRRILRDRPRITSLTMSVTMLRALPENSVGLTYVDWLDREGVSPDTRDSVKYIDNEECAYVMQRYRESHDFYHALTGLPVFVEGEVALKAFEFANTLLPMAGLSTFAVTRMKPAERSRFWHTYLPWALSNGLNSKDIINVYWEEELERDVDDLRTELGIERPPDLRETRKTVRKERRAAKDKREKIGGLMAN
ncbi:Ubiquinone biosynthesis protein [Mycoblastus sanguinarius]|nr:Ubiquinone biosynthesis protein [Mycoblastus sanguinarius]